MDKLVSVIMSTYNESSTQLRFSIDSILNQSYENYEFIIVLDNPNNNNIKNILEEYRKNNKEIKLIYNIENIGLANSLNLAIKIAKGEYIARMDADDISFPDRIERQVKYLEISRLDMVATNRIDINESGECLPVKSNLPKTEFVNKILPIGNFITHPTVLIKTGVMKSLHGYRDFSSSQDYDLWLRLISSGYKIGILDEPLIYYRIRENSISTSDRLKQYLFNKYQKELYENRILEGKDEFSIENLERYLRKANYYDEENRNRFNHAHEKFTEGIMMIKKSQYLSGIIKIITSIKENKEMINCLKDNFIYQIIRRKYI